MNAAYEIVENLEILGLTPGSTLKEIRSAFRSLARTCHPDVAGPQSEKAFERITGAYMLLKNLSPELLQNPPVPREKAGKSRSRSPFSWKRREPDREKTQRTARDEAPGSEDEHIRGLRLEKALLDAELEMAKLRQQLKTQEEESEVGKLILRLSSTHPTVRMLAVSASVEWIRSPVLQNAVDDMLRRFPPDRDMMLLIPNLARDRELHLRFATVIAGRAGSLDEAAALLFLQWTGALRERGPLLAKFLAHPSHAVLTGTLQRWPAKHPVPDDLSLLRLLRIDDEDILLPLLRLLRGAPAPVWARPRLKNLADAHPSPGVRVWARSIVGSADLV